MIVIKVGDTTEIVKCDGVTQNGDDTANLAVASSGRSISPTSPFAGASTGLDFQTGEVIVSNDVLSMSYFLRSNNDETITGKHSFPSSESARPRLSSNATTAVDEALVSFKELSEAMQAGGTNASETQAGYAEQATLGEGLSGAESGSSGKLFITPLVLQKILQGQASTYLVEDGSGSDDTYTTTATPTITVYTTGQVFTVKFAVLNTGACTLNIDSVGAKSIKKWVNGAKAELETGDIIANFVAMLEYDGTDFMLLSMTATMPTTALLSEMSTFFASTDITPAQANTLIGGGNADALHTHSLNLLILSKTLASHQLGEDDAEVASGSTTGNFTKRNQSMTLANGGSGGTYVHWTDALVDDWSKDFNFDIFAGFNTATNLVGYIGTGLGTVTSPSSTTQTKRHVGFFFNSSGETFASMADGSTQELSSDLGITFTDLNHFRIEFTGGTSAKFYINEVLVATLSTNPPTSGQTDYSTAHLSANGASTTLTTTYPVLDFVLIPQT